MLEFTAALLLVAGIVWLAIAYWLRGADLSAWDAPVVPGAGSEGREEQFAAGDAQGAERRAVLAALGRMLHEIQSVPFKQRLGKMRSSMDALTQGRDFAARFVPADAGGVAAEWVLAAGADPARRTLYIHGGAFTAGSPRSHRSITSKFAKISAGAVLAIDYRLMPEHARRAGIEDCRSAYRWLLANGPNGAAPASTVFVAGDSAGGNLALALIAWVRDEGLRSPDAAVALSPATDSTFASPSLKANLDTDPMLGPIFRHLARIPRPALLWWTWLQARIRPADADVSPLRGDLSNLPPLLIQASRSEMLIDDARRYTNKALAAGSPVRLQTWPDMVHVWQIFDPDLPEAAAAFEEIRKFLQAAAPPRPALATA